MNFGIELVPNVDCGQILELAKIAEESNFDYIWVTDHYCNRNVYSVLTLLAIKTSKVKLGAGVANPYHVHPAITASAIATVNEISNGRAVLGLAAGDRLVLNEIGITWDRPIKRIKEAVDVIRLLFSGDRVSYNGEFFKLSNAKLNFKSGNVKIFIGAQGPKMVKLAVEIGDGLLMNSSNPQDYVQLKSIVKKKEFELAAFTSFCMDKNSAKAKDYVRNVVAFIIASSSSAFLKRYGFEEKAEEIRKSILKRNWSEIKSIVSDEIVEIMSLSGSEDEIIEKIDKFKKFGVNQIVIGSPIGLDKKRTIKEFGERIISLFKEELK